MPNNNTLTISNLKLEYRAVGDIRSHKEIIVMLHEGLGCVSLWNDFPERLAEATGWRVITYSRSGYGSSSPCDLLRPWTYMHDEAFEVLPAVLDRVGFDGGILLGHSDGASIAAIYAGAHSDDRLRGLVLIAPISLSNRPSWKPLNGPGLHSLMAICALALRSTTRKTSTVHSGVGVTPG